MGTSSVLAPASSGARDGPWHHAWGNYTVNPSPVTPGSVREDQQFLGRDHGGRASSGVVCACRCPITPSDRALAFFQGSPVRARGLQYRGLHATDTL